MHMPASTINQRYVLHDVLGRGETGYVCRAYDSQTNLDVAIKFFTLSCNTTTLLNRFAREIRILKSVCHKNILEIIDAGISEDSIPFFTMPLLIGETLDSRLKKETPTYDVAIDIATQILVGLCAAHQASIVHRDLKPANIFLVKEPQKDFRTVKILDFGISKILDSQTRPLTDHNIGIGTEAYMAPEQVMNARDVDQRADIYSVGVILYQLFCGRLPNEPSSSKEHLSFHPHPVKSPVYYNSHIQNALGDLLLIALSRNPQNRFNDAKQMLDSFTQIIQSPNTIDLSILHCKKTLTQLTRPKRRKNKILEILNYVKTR